jgi:hypothetical protein
MAEVNIALPSIDRWEAGQIELVVFPVDWQFALGQDWWRQITGTECESIRRQNERVDAGMFRGVHLRFSVNPVRTSWSVSPHVQLTMEDGITGPPTIGSFVDAIAWFVPLMNAWIRESCPDAIRFGFTATLLQFADSREEIYRLLNAYLSKVEVDPASKEFQFRINRPRMSKSGIPGLEINRLSTWSSVLMTIRMDVRSVTAQPNAGPRHSMHRDFQACMLNLDINSSQDFNAPLPRENREALWSELVELAREVAEKGDIQ